MLLLIADQFFAALCSIKVPKDEVILINSDPTIPASESSLTALGMGRISEGGPISNVLLSTKVFPVATAECQASYPEFLVNGDVVICAAGDGTDR
jgi:hypothetical protein